MRNGSLNPWETIALTDYEGHMSLESVYQAQTLEMVMADQLCRWPVRSAMVLGIAGGNGLSQVDPLRIERLVGVDINAQYLAVCQSRYPGLKGVFQPLRADLLDEEIQLPHVQLVIANLLVEYIGCEPFARRIAQIKPDHVSVAIQKDEGEEFVSDSPYLHTFDCLEPIHEQIQNGQLTAALNVVGYQEAERMRYPLPNGKALLRLDFERRK